MQTNGKKKGICMSCGAEFEVRSWIKNHRYCGKKKCQRVRKTRWQRQKMREDKEYQENQQSCQKSWAERNKGYWKKYRNGNPGYVKRNREMQIIRNMRQKINKGRQEEGKKGCLTGREIEFTRIIAKMDSVMKPYYRRDGTMFKLLFYDRFIAKMDSLVVKLLPV